MAFNHRETLGFDLPETRLSAGLETEARLTRRWHLDAQGSLGTVLRPGWSDPYQPVLDASGQPTGLGSTDRYGYDQLRAGLGAGWHPRAYALRLRGSIERRVYHNEPAWDPILAPTHLVPFDRDTHAVTAHGAGRWLRGHLKARLRLDVAWTERPFERARDARTGLTHAGLGGEPANPARRDRALGGHLRLGYWWKALASRLRLGGGYQRTEDLFDGYYTHDTWRAGADLRVRPGARLAVEVGYELRLWRYTDDGYAEGPDHPPLDGGEALRAARRHALSARVERRSRRPDLTPFLEARWASTATNFPDYEPYVFPANQAYDVPFDHEDLRVELGTRWRF